MSVGNYAIEAFTCMMFFKNIFSFALTWKGYDWLVQSGSIKPIFVAIGSVQVGVCLLTVPLCKFFLWRRIRLTSADFFGKRIRYFMSQHDMLAPLERFLG
jgi:hypothetical protein